MLLKKVAATFLVGFGGICIIAGIYAPFNSDISRQERTAQAVSCLLVGIPLTGWGALIFRGVGQQAKKQASDRLQSIFYRLIQQTNGQITVMHFAIEAQLPGKEAKQYLDQKAKEFQAAFEVTENGDVTYRFHL
jgi:hypothetical protein